MDNASELTVHPTYSSQSLRHRQHRLLHGRVETSIPSRVGKFVGVTPVLDQVDVYHMDVGRADLK